MSLLFTNDFKNTPPEEMPREKLFLYGSESLSMWELIAILLKTGSRYKGGHSENIKTLSKRLLQEGGFKGLFQNTSVKDTMESYGIQKRHAETLVAVTEICRRIYGKFDSFDVSEPEKVFTRFQYLQQAKQEQCFVLHVDSKRKCTYQELVAIGQKNSVQVSPNDILRTPIWIGTEEIIVVHNHPNLCMASQEDISWTLTIAKGSWELHGIKISDHIIIGKDGYFSFQEKGLL